jgi:hypothetical protein
VVSAAHEKMMLLVARSLTTKCGTTTHVRTVGRGWASSLARTSSLVVLVTRR